jgi:hypothetical protein
VTNPHLPLWKWTNLRPAPSNWWFYQADNSSPIPRVHTKHGQPRNDSRNLRVPKFFPPTYHTLFPLRICTIISVAYLPGDLPPFVEHPTYRYRECITQTDDRHIGGYPSDGGLSLIRIQKIHPAQFLGMNGWWRLLCIRNGSGRWRCNDNGLVAKYRTRFRSGLGNDVGPRGFW